MSLFKEFKKSKNVNVWKELDSICSGENYIRDEARSEIKQGELFDFTPGFISDIVLSRAY